MSHDLDSAERRAWFPMALLAGLARLEELIQALERGHPSLGIDPTAWDNSLAALEWAVALGLRNERVVDISLTEDDLHRIQRVHILGNEALQGGYRAPELLPLACECLRALEEGAHVPPA